MGRAGLKPTAEHAHERDYLRPGGPWDVPPLDALLTTRALGSPLPGDARALAELLVDGELRLGSAEVNERVARLAGGLRARGVHRGDVVAWQAPNWHEVVLLYRACWRLGAVAAPLHHRAGEAEVDAMRGQVHPVVTLAAEGLPLAAREGTVVLRSPAGGFDELMDSEPVLEPAGRPTDLACVLFTSGSSGRPKGVLHTQRGLACKALLMRDVHGLRPDDAVLMPAPLAHISGLLNAVLNPGVVPMKTVLMERWNLEAAIGLVEAERITFMIGPPTFFVEMMRSPGFTTERMESVRLLSCGGAGVTPAFVETATRAFGATVKRTYGSTEAPTVTTSHAGDDPVRAAETDGRPAGETELRVVDSELWVRGPELFVGYLNESQTEEAFDGNGWFRTGDLATLDEEGWLTVVGRLKDIVIRKGENISTGEVEAVLEAHPAVRQAVAVGEPDEEVGERVVAFVVATEPFDLDTCRAWFESRGVARYKTPEKVLQLDEIPVLAAGKPDRAALLRLLS